MPYLLFVTGENQVGVPMCLAHRAATWSGSHVWRTRRCCRFAEQSFCRFAAACKKLCVAELLSKQLCRVAVQSADKLFGCDEPYWYALMLLAHTGSGLVNAESAAVTGQRKSVKSWQG